VVLYAGIGNERPSAVGIGAPDLLGHGFCLQEKTMTLVRAVMLRKYKNQIRRRWVINSEGQRKNIQGRYFLTGHLYGDLNRQKPGTSSPAAISACVFAINGTMGDYRTSTG
jgi:hypothetical protein